MGPQLKFPSMMCAPFASTRCCQKHDSWVHALRKQQVAQRANGLCNNSLFHQARREYKFTRVAARKSVRELGPNILLTPCFSVLPDSLSC